MHNPIIFSDLDGTLLDHDNYSFEAALPALKKLKQHKIPVIATTSKTIQEVINLYEALNISGPFIVENGAAVYIPKATFKEQPKETIEQQHFWVKHFSQPREKYIAIVNKLKARFEYDFTHFAQMSSDDIANATGLSIPGATLANQRQFGEPVLWLSNNLQKQHFISAAKSLGANVLEGGRFIHICDDCDKGKALNWLAGEYQHQLKLDDMTAIALGDSGNDIAMLEAADIAVQIKSPSHDYPSIDTTKVPRIYQTQGFGPTGWQEAIEHLIDFSNLNSNFANITP